MKDIHDIKEPILLSFNYLPLIIFISILLLLFLILLFLSLKKLGKRNNSKIEPVGISKNILPKQKALDELKRISDKKMIENNQIDLFYNRSSQILKDYIKEQYLLDLSSKTNSEILNICKNHIKNQDFIINMEFILKDLDLAKYSKYKPQVTITANFFESMINLIKLGD